MRRWPLLLVVVLGLILACSKKTSPPTAPNNPAPNPVCSLSPTTLGFGTVAVGSSADLSFTLTNTGTGTLSGTVTDTCGGVQLVGSGSYSLGAGQSAAFTIRFAPTTAKAYSCPVTVGSCALTATGTGVLPPGSCRVTPTSLDFGTVPVGQTVDRVFHIVNTGASTLGGTVSTGCDGYSIPDQSSYSLSPGDSTSFVVRLSPTHGGSEGCTVMTGSGACSNVTCTATGQEVCAVSPTSLDFGLVASGSTVHRSFTIRNPGTAVLTGIVGTDGTCPYFDIGGVLIPYALSSQESLVVNVAFKPFGGEGVFGCTILTGNPGCPSVTCSGAAEFPCNCSVQPTTFPFGDVIVGQQAVRTFTISTGGETAIGGVISVVGEGYLLSTPQNPNLTSQSLGYVVNANTSQAFNVVFAPQTLGIHAATVAISQTLCTRIGTACDTLRCTGTGITTPPPPVCAVSSTNISFGTYYAPQVKDTTLTLTNTGGSTLSGSIYFRDSSAAPFSLVGSTGYSLGAGQSQDFTVRFTAPNVQPGHTESDVRTIDLGTACAAVSPVTVQATAIPTPPICQVTPATLDFGSVPAGQTKDLVLTVKNIGGGTLSGSAIPGCPQDFNFIGATSYALGAGQSASFTVRFTPGAVGNFQCYVSVGFSCPSVVTKGTGS
jgi:HYDIN/CFA65/VesB family protein